MGNDERLRTGRVSQWRAPGRVNLIGEHTDYNDGFVLPFALQVGTTATVEQRGDRVVHVRSVQRDAPVSASLEDLRPGQGADWSGYVLGVLWALQRGGHELPGLSIEIDSTVPVGSGLS